MSPFTLNKSSAPAETQLSLPIAPPSPIVSFEPVPADLKLGSDRHYITIRQGDRYWHYPLQFRSDELQLLIPQIIRWNWTLSDDGVPVELDAVHRGIEFLVGEVSK